MNRQVPQRVKIVATIGPASSSRNTVGALIDAGMDVARLNFSHGDQSAHQSVFSFVREQSAKRGIPVAVLADLSGPKIRVGKMRGGAVELSAGRRIRVTTENVLGDDHRITTTYAGLHRDVSTGDHLLLDDGQIELVVRSVERGSVLCDVSRGGTLRDNKGMNLPGTSLSAPSLTEKDRHDIEFARQLGVDYIALSFVRRAEDVVEAKAMAGDIPVIAKIEKPEAIANLAAIIEAADGLMVARGDLGVETGAEKVPLLQKRIIRDASKWGRPVIVATQMMESMIERPFPTRAEVSDVANAVVDGTDAVMLSGETAVGRYPVETVTEVAAVVDAVEKSDILKPSPHSVQVNDTLFSNAIARAAVTAATEFRMAAIAVYTETGYSASLVSAYRPAATVVAFSRHHPVLRRLALRWGVLPMHTEWLSDETEMVRFAAQVMLDRGLVGAGDDMAVAFGRKSIRGRGSTDTLRLVRVSEVTSTVPATPVNAD